MRLADFIEKVRSEPERTIKRPGLQITPELFAKAREQGGIGLSEILAAQTQPAQLHELRYRHVLGPPASEDAIASWHAQRPSQLIPADLLALVKVANGVHFWANAKTGRSYTGLAPIEEWEIARVKMYGPESRDQLLTDQYVAISYDVDHGSFIVLDTASGKYYSMETSGPDTSSPIASNLEELLDWLWRYRGMPPE